MSLAARVTDGNMDATLTALLGSLQQQNEAAEAVEQAITAEHAAHNSKAAILRALKTREPLKERQLARAH